MKNIFTRVCRFTLLAFTVLLCTAVAGNGKTADYNSMSKGELQAVIAPLELGIDSYIIGKKLNAEQLAASKKDNDYKAYPGTVKFKDNGLFVVADAETNVVVAVYTRDKAATIDDYKNTIGALMMQYGEPTAEAHGKTIYWNYGPDGLISEELYRTAKADGLLDTVVVLATIKFSSSTHMDSMVDMIKKMEKKGTLKEKEEEKLSDNYIMIQSDLLSKKYVDGQ